MDDEQYKEFVEYFTTKSVPHSVVNIKLETKIPKLYNWRTNYFMATFIIESSLLKIPEKC